MIVREFSQTVKKTWEKTEAEWDRSTAAIGSWLDKHPRVNKVVLVANHIFRIVGMVGFMSIVPFSSAATFGIALAASIFYRITIERFCQFRFALPSCLGGAAFEVSRPALVALISGVAFESLTAFGLAVLRAAPIGLCAIAIVYLSHDAIEKKLSRENSCCAVAI